MVGIICKILLDLVEAVGGKDALKRWPVWFKMSGNSRDFLERQQAIHNSLAAGVCEESKRRAVADKFRIDKNGDEIITHYRSENQHCSLYKTLARWIIRYYGDEASIGERRCMREGADECEIHVRWTRLGVMS